MTITRRSFLRRAGLAAAVAPVAAVVGPGVVERDRFTVWMGTDPAYGDRNGFVTVYDVDENTVAYFRGIVPRHAPDTAAMQAEITGVARERLDAIARKVKKDLA